MFKAVVFDFDGLIVDTESVWYEVFKEVMQEYEVNLRLEDFAKCIGTSSDVLYKKLNALSNRPIDKIVVKEKTTSLYQQRMNQFTLREGVLDYLDTAKSLGLQIGLASSSSREWVVGFLERFGIMSYFEVIKTSDDVKRVKPDPELYLQAINELGVDTQETFCFEDSINGLKAAVQAGLQCVIVPNLVTQHLEFSGHIHRLNSMSDLLLGDLLEQLQLLSTGR